MAANYRQALEERSPLPGSPTLRTTPVPGRMDVTSGEGLDDPPDPDLYRDTLVDGTGAAEDHAAQARARLGRVLEDRWQLTEILGAGATGTVYRAFDRFHGSEVAVKILHDGLRASSEHVARFEREARAASAVSHSSVVRVTSAGRDRDGLFYTVLELLEGEALFHAIEGRRLSVADVVEIGRQLLGALGAAHARGIVHRDVKPENLFLAREPSGALRLKLIDFGIAKVLHGKNGAPSTMEGMVVGTPHYMSPEMCRGERITAAADLWSAAAVLYHALTGTPPFDDVSVGQLLVRIATGRAPSVGEARPDLPPDLVRVIDRALDPDPFKRFQSARQFSDALSIGGAPVDGLDY